MPAHSNPKLPPPAEPRYSRNFDPWHSVAAGHQRPETRGPQGWRESRNMKMNSQFRAGNSGGPRISDTVGLGSEDFDERLGMLVPKQVRARAGHSVADMLRNPGSMRPASRAASRAAEGAATAASSNTARPHGPVPVLGAEEGRENRRSHERAAEEQLALARQAEDEAREPREADKADKAQKAQERRIFDGLVVYVNGSTHPLVSDHKLKHLLSEHGARMSLHLGRRQVTHVILGKPSGPNGGAGGGLAGGKLEKEIRRVGGSGIRFVGVEW
ncbi:uncharacterized protein THITE_2106365 [Thermothielavioides terrestris NRRL 8126]|uniref:BRCT domain-containing protein n=1 Tax=Thermothielavioides terrestris (strain ATCC 38088 / NRRL 8126) TaxID=578455 RepID=G2QX94_THETT|nr:uncharacterized protein THITE_2106365 [Thermothielavioides terrestris NRRL 8126]AEO62315.1 hypothetical protein THITE_2106365 [Thermothielavioides terrestris NRRL 8126]